jgi:hypothetical protein
MISRRFISPFLIALFGSAFFVFSQTPVNEPQTGEALAAEIRSMQPEGNSEISGTLKIRSPNRHEDIPVLCKISTNGNSWKTIYQTAATDNRGAEKLVVVHSLDQPNQYFYARASSPKTDLPEPKKLTSDEAAIPLAGSDFWLSELGFDFLHWPEQKKLKGEMRLGQPCYVLESRNPNGKKIVRVKSWIDKESNGPLIAEAFDAENKLVKEFSLGGSSFKKVNGVFQLKKMTIRSPREKSETVLEFDLPPD